MTKAQPRGAKVNVELRRTAEILPGAVVLADEMVVARNSVPRNGIVWVTVHCARVCAREYDRMC